MNSPAEKEKQAPQRALRILLLTTTMEPSGTSWYTMELARGLQEQGHKVLVACGGGSQTRHLAEDKIETVVLKTLSFNTTTLSSILPLYNIVKKFNPDIIHGQSLKVMNTAYILSMLTRRPYFLTVHHFVPENKTIRFSKQWCRGIIAVSESLREHMVNKIGVPKQNMFVCHNGVDFKRYIYKPPVRENDRLVVVGTSGKLIQRKGHIYFLRAVSALINDGIDLEVLIAGSGPERLMLKEAAVSLGIDKKITIISHDVPTSAVINALDIFVLPSLQEGFGYSLLEAMASGKPVVASSVGGTYAVVRDGENGFLVPSAKPQALAEGIRKLIEDDDLRVQMGKRGREIVEDEFSLDVMITNMLQIYNSIFDGLDKGIQSPETAKTQN